MIKKSLFFSSDFESVIAQHLIGKILNFDFYPKANYFECKFWIKTDRLYLRGLDLGDSSACLYSLA